jgi:hypothetical protein
VLSFYTHFCNNIFIFLRQDSKKLKYIFATSLPANHHYQRGWTRTIAVVLATRTVAEELGVVPVGAWLIHRISTTSSGIYQLDILTSTDPGKVSYHLLK